MSRHLTHAGRHVLLLGGTVLLAIAVGLLGPQCASRGRAIPTSFLVKVPTLSGAPGVPPTIGWAASDSEAVFIGFAPGETNPWGTGPPIGALVQLPGRQVRRTLTAADLYSPRSIWDTGLGNPRTPFAVVTGVSIRVPRFYSVGFLPVPSRVEWVPHGFGIQSVILPRASRSVVLLRRWVWNLPAPAPHTGALRDPRGAWCGFVLRGSNAWEVWLWPEASSGS